VPELSRSTSQSWERTKVTSYDSRSLSRGFKILECLGESSEALSVAEVARRTGLHRATVHRTLTVLTQLGYVHKSHSDLLYTTGFYLHTLGYVDHIIGSIKYHSRRFMKQLSADTGGLPVTLGALEGNLIVICDVVDGGAEPERVAARIGARYDAHATALGKVLMAYRPQDEIRRRYENHALQTHAKNTIKALPLLMRELRDIRRAGYATEDSELSVGVRAVAAAIVNPAERATCAISVEGPAHRLNERTMPRLIERVRATAGAISSYIIHPDREEKSALASKPRVGTTPRPQADTDAKAVRTLPTPSMKAS
jgi:IclR family KDG regulon transcriptional repressor